MKVCRSQLIIILSIIMLIILVAWRTSFMRTMFPDDMDQVESDGYYGKATDVMDGFKTTTSPSGMYVKQIKPEDRMVATGIERPTGVQSYSIAFLEKGE